MKQNNKNTTIMTVVLVLWCVFTLVRVWFHQPWFDEGHAWMLARDYSFLELVAQMKEEGHLLLWFLLLKPFAMADFYFPYPMQILNWLFAFAALLILWKKAPFHWGTKVCITLSYTFLAQLPVIARCYALGVAFLFALCAMYKNSLKHPIAYSATILLAANTSLMAIFGAVPLGVFFCVDMIRAALAGRSSKKDFIISFSILALCSVLILWQIGQSGSVNVPYMDTFLGHFRDFLFGKSLVINIINALTILALIFWAPFVFREKSKRALCFVAFTFSMLLYCFLFKYSGWSHHYVFFGLFLLMAFWIMKAENSLEPDCKSVKILEIMISVLFFCQIFCPAIFNHAMYGAQTETYYKEISSIENIENSRLIMVVPKDIALAPYFAGKSTELYWYYSGMPANENLFFFEKSILARNDKLYILPTLIKDLMAEDKENYLLVNFATDKPFAIKDRKYILYLEPKFKSKLKGKSKLFSLKLTENTEDKK